MASMKTRIKNLVERSTNTHIFRILPHGVDPFCDIERLLRRFAAEVIFDVGANLGQSTMQFQNHFPRARSFALSQSPRPS